MKLYKEYLAYLLSIFQILIYLFVFPAYADDCVVTPQAKLVLTYNGFVPTASATINDHVIEMGIDTGAQRSVITPELANRLNLPHDLNHHTQVYGTSGHQTVPNAFVDNLAFAGISYPHISLPTVSLKLANIGNTASPDEKMEGLIGSDILSHYDLEFDFPAKRLTLYRVSHCESVIPPWSKPYMTMPMIVTPSHRPTIQIELDGNLATAIFDTGASGERLDPSATSRVGLTNDIIANDPIHAGAGVGGDPYKVPSHKFSRIKIGTETYKDIPMDIVSLGSNEADSLLGEDYIHSRKFWLSYATQTLYVQ